MTPFEELDNTAGAGVYLANAERILSVGWERRNYACIALNAPIPWALRNDEERSWNFHIQALDLIDGLLRGYSHGGRSDFLGAAIRVALDWVSTHLEGHGDELSPFTWYDMAVGMRAYRLAYVIDAGTCAGLLDDGERNRLWAALLEHQKFLADDRNIAFHNNHGYYQVAGQLAMGRRFSAESIEMANAYTQGRARLGKMLEQQFSSDGVHREHSPDYHRMVYDTLRAIIDSGLVENPEIELRGRCIERGLSCFILPSTHIAGFGDSDYRSMKRAPEQAVRKWVTEEMRYVVTGGKIGTPSDRHVAAFEEGGYFVVRKPSLEHPDDFSRSSYLAQIAAFHSRTHKHADDLSFIWCDRGSDILVDSGRYGYIGKTEQGSELWKQGFWYSDPRRIYCESTRAHNTLEFDGRDYPRKGVKPYGSALRRWLEDESGLIAVETECKHFGSIRRVRLLVVMPGQWLVVFDWFNDNLGEPHSVRQWFHLAPDLQLHPDRQGFAVLLPRSEEPLRVAPLLAGVATSRPYLGEEEPQMQGWWSGKERDIVPNYAFCFEMEGAPTGSIATLFDFSGQVVTATDWSKVNVSGRKGQLRWSDDAGRHTLRFERPASGPLQVAHELESV